MLHCRLCPECSSEMEWHKFNYYCPNCKITQFPYSVKAIIGVTVICLVTYGLVMI